MLRGFRFEVHSFGNRFLDKAGLPLPMPARVAISVLVTLTLSVIVGMPVPTAMSAVKQHNEQAVAWMWGINCAFNGIGATSFAMISGQLGVRASFLIVAAVYLIANVLFCLTLTRLKPKE